MDDAVDQCSGYFNLRESIDNWRIKSEEVTDVTQKKIYVQKGVLV